MLKRQLAQISLYRRYRHRIYNYFWHRVGGIDSQAEDLTAECFLQVIKSWDSFEADRSESAWLYGIARHLLCHYYREYGRELELDPEHPGLSAPDCRAEMSLDLSRAMSAIRDLPAYHRDVLLLRHDQGLSNQEIAQVLAKSEGAVRVQISRATKLLRDKLSQYGYSQ